MFSERKIWNDGAPFEDFMGRDGAPPVARRHLAFGGGKGGSGGTTYQQQTTTIPPEVQARYNAVNARAEQVAQQPFQPYQGQFVAPLTATQQAGTAQIANAGQGYQPYQQAATTALTGSAEAALPYYGQAGQNIGAAQAAGAPYTGAATMAGLAGAQSVNPGQLDIGRYMDPYLQSVVAPTMQGLYQQQQQQQSQLMGSQAMRGAFGGDRGSIAAANLARQQGLAAQQAQGGLLSQGYGQALQAAQQQQGVGLGAEQANRAAMQQLSPQLLQIGQQAFQQPMAAAQAQQGLGQGLLGYGQGVSQSLAGLGQMGTQTGLASGQALLGAGTLEQQTQQQLNAALYNQYQQQQGYPFQVAQFLANIAMGTGPLYGSTTSGVTGQPTPFFSDERVKEDITEIGRTHDGQKIIKFKYKGSNQPQIGLSAQDVEKHHPEAVSETPEGIKAVDYDMATQHAERAYGGGLMPSSEGGAVHPSMAGLGFASGGTPVPGANPEVDEMLRGLAPRRAFATAGAVTPGVDAYTQQLLQSLVNPMGGTTPHGANGKLPHKPGAWSPGVAKASPLLKGSLPSLPQQQQSTGLSQAIGGVKDAVGAYRTGEDVYKGGQDVYKWAQKQLDRQPSGVSPDGATTGGNKITSTDLPAPAQTSAPPAQTSGLGAATPTRVADAGSGLAPETAVASLDALPTEDIADLGEGMSMFAARGGRIGYEGGGLTGSNPALPYSGGDDKSIIEDIADDPMKSQDQKIGHKLDMSDKGGGQKKDPAGGALKGAMSGASAGATFGPWGALAGGVLGGASSFLARGGAADIEHAKRLISRVESGGRYDILGEHDVPGQGRAHGKYQVMPNNIPSWTEEALGRRMTPAEFLKSPEAQERVFEHRFGKFLDQHGNLADAASMWHSNLPLAEARRQGRRDANMSTEDYVRKVIGGAPPAEAHMRTEAPPQRSAGIAPPLHDAEVEAPPPVDANDDFEMFNDFEMPIRFAAGGLVPRHGYQTDGAVEAELAAAQPVVPSISEEELQRGVRSAPFARPSGLGGMNLPQHQLPPALEPHVKASLDAEARGSSPMPAPTSIPIPPRSVSPAERTRDDRDLSGYNPPGSAPAVAPPLASRNVATVGGNNPPAVTPVVAGGPSTAPQAQTAAGLAPPVGAPGGSSKPPEDRDFFTRTGDWMGRNQNWLLPAVSGIGKMLASPSPYLGVAIGQGLAEGAQTGLGASFKQQGLDIQQQNADIAAARQLYGVYTDLGARIANSQGVPGVDLDPLQKQYQNLSRQINRLIGKYVKSPEEAAELLTGGGSGGGAPTAAPASGAPTAAPGGGAPTAAPASGAPTAAPGGGPPTPVGGQPAPASDQSDIPMWARRAQTTDQQRALIKQNIDPMQDPDVLRQRAAQAAQTDPNGQIVKDLLEKANRIQTTMLDVGKVPTKNGVMTLPGWSDARSEVERVDDNTKWRNTYEPRQTQHTSQLATIDELTRALQEVQSGPAAGTINKYTSLIAQLAGVDVRTMLSNPEAYYKARKDAYKLINDSFGSSGTRTDMQLGTQIDASAYPDLPPNTNKAIIAQLKAKAEWTKERDKWLYDQMQRYGAHIDRGGAAQEWGAKNEADLIKRIGETYKNTAVLGDINDALDRQGKPIPSKLTEGQMYMVPVGNGQFKQARYMGLNPQTGKTRWE